MNRSMSLCRFAVQKRCLHTAFRRAAMVPVSCVKGVKMDRVNLLKCGQTAYVNSVSRRGHVSIGPSDNVHYEELVALVQGGDLQLFDVREPSECQNTGLIPGAVNIPLGELGQAFLLKPDAFREKYGVDMPEKTDDDVVFYCLGGVRSAGALAMVQTVGFKNSRHFPGGWSEWAKRQKQ